MARVRSLNPDVWTDKRVLSLPWPAVAFYIGTISIADDYGRIEWSSVQLASRIVASRPDVALNDVSGWMEALLEKRLLIHYEIEGEAYAFHPKWRKHQYVSRPGKSLIPAPPLHLQCKDTEDAVQEQCNGTEKIGPLDTDTGMELDTVLDMDSELGLLRSVFREAEEDVARFLAMVASKNRTGKITAGREITIRAELMELVKTSLGGVLPALCYGIDAAVKKGADNTNYVKQAALTWLRRPANQAKILPFKSSPTRSADDEYRARLRAETEGIA